LSLHHDFWRVFAHSVGTIGRHKRVAAFVFCAAIVGAAGLALAQAMSEQQIRCLQLQRELTSAPAGGGGGGDDLQAIQAQITQYQRVYEGTKATMEDAGCFESFFIFGRGLVRSPKCISMNDRMEDAGRQLSQLQQQRDAIRGGASSKRRQAEMQDALARNGCSGQVAPPPQRRGGGGLFDWFGGKEAEPEQPQAPISRSIDPSGHYRSICVRLCDGFFYPISYSTYAGRLTQDATECQSNCAAPAELYVYRNPGEEPAQAISLNGSPYADLPVAFKYKKAYVKGCSCKQAEYNPTEIESANKAEAEAVPAAKVKGGAKKATPVPPAAAPQAAAPLANAGPPAQLDLDITGSGNANGGAGAPPPQAATAPVSPAGQPSAQAAPAQTAPAQAAPAQPAQQSTIVKSKTPPPPQ
jgi:hypothetical protein